jgi:general stress protein 26
MSSNPPTIHDIRQFLANNRKAVLSTVSPSGNPEAAMMLYVVEDIDLVLYWGTKKSFRKYENLKANPHVAVTVMQAVEDPLVTVQLEGVVEFIAPEQEEFVYSLFDHKNPSKFFVRGASDFVLFKVVPQWVRILDGTSGQLHISEFNAPFK